MADLVVAHSKGKVGSPLTEEDKEASRKLLEHFGGLDGFDLYLLGSTYVHGETLSRVDELLAHNVGTELKSWKAKQFDKYNNISRWFDHVQSTPEISKSLEYTVSIPIPAPLVFKTAGAKVDAVAAPSAAPNAVLKVETIISKAPVSPPVQEKSGGSTEKAANTDTKKVEDGGAKKGGESSGSGAAKNGKKGRQPAAGKQQKGGKGQGAAAAASPTTEFGKLNIIVGKIESVQNHPDADSLYVEKINVGESEPREVVSGLRKHIPLEEFKGMHVLVLANLKPAKMRGILSSGMVLCASTADKLEVLSPPQGAKIGERLTVEGEVGEPLPVLVPKKKEWDKIRDSGDLTVNADGIITYKGKPLTSSAGPVASKKKLTGAKVA